MGLFDKIGSFAEKTLGFATDLGDAFTAFENVKAAFDSDDSVGVQPSFQQSVPFGPPQFEPPPFFGPPPFVAAAPQAEQPMTDSPMGLLLIGVATGVVVWLITRK